MPCVKHGSKVLGIVLVFRGRLSEVEHGGDLIGCAIEDTSCVETRGAVDTDDDYWDGREWRHWVLELKI